MKVKIAKMQELFGVTDKRTCIECRNLCRKVAGGRTVYKCGVYGIANSTASDWQAGYPACGMYNQGYTGTPVIEIVKHQSRTEPDEQLPGQVSIDEYLNDLPEEEKEPACDSRQVKRLYTKEDVEQEICRCEHNFTLIDENERNSGRLYITREFLKYDAFRLLLAEIEAEEEEKENDDME